MTTLLRMRIPLVVAALALMASGCATSSPTEADPMPTDSPSALSTNPLLAEWTGPYGGVPAFDRMDLDSLEPAIEAGMAAHLAEIDAIAQNPAAPTFENTIVAMERSGQPLNRAFTYYGIWSANLSTPEFREIQGRLSPKIAEYGTQITQNADLFARVRSVYDERESLGLDDAEVRLVELVYDEFARNGATLTGADKERYAAIDTRLAELYTQFGNNVLADEEGYVTYISEDQLSGLPESFVRAAAVAAEERDRPGEYAITNTRSSMDPFLTYSDERDLRETVWRTYYSRADNGDEADNNAVIQEILALRDERVGLLGYDNYAAWRLENRMAQTPERAMDLLMDVWPAAVARVEEEVADMQAVADDRGDGITIEPWDYRYYAEKVRQDRYALDSDEVKQYLQLDNLVEGMHYVAGELFGWAFTPVPEGTVPVFHPDVTVYEVTERETGDHVGLWYLDPFARQGKRSGAWATTYRSHSTVFGQEETVLGSNNSNFVKGAPGEPVLISFDDAETLFHEFGHALHYFSSAVDYPSLNGAVRDYVEFQSQLLERWLLTQPVIDNYLVHVETGEPIPAELVEKIRRAVTFNQGFATTEYLASALIDMELHTAEDPGSIDPDAFERETLERLGLPSELVMRHRTPHFSHVFSGEGYATGYYGYLWADVLTSDAAEAFADAPGGFYDAEVARRAVEYLFAPQNSLYPAEAYRLFRGRDADIAPLMRDRGFPVPADAE